MIEKIDSILIIDDDPITVFGIRKILDSIIEYKFIDSFINGKVALDFILEALNRNAIMPDVIFLDLNMPIMDGWQFLKRFIELPIEKKVRINIITSSIDAHDRERWEFYKEQTHHLVTYNQKPVQRSQLIEITKSA